MQLGSASRINMTRYRSQRTSPALKTCDLTLFTTVAAAPYCVTRSFCAPALSMHISLLDLAPPNCCWRMQCGVM